MSEEPLPNTDFLRFPEAVDGKIFKVAFSGPRACKRRLIEESRAYFWRPFRGAFVRGSTLDEELKNNHRMQASL
jgi:hypothetical protein